MSQEIAPQKPVLFYDGVCGLCDSTVQFLLRHRNENPLYFSPLQGETAKAILSSDDRMRLESLVFVEGDQIYHKSQAVLRLSQYVTQPWATVFKVLKIVPTSIANMGYDLVARYRYRIFGRFENCRIPRPEEKAFFLP